MLIPATLKVDPLDPWSPATDPESASEQLLYALIPQGNLTAETTRLSIVPSLENSLEVVQRVAANVTCVHVCPRVRVCVWGVWGREGVGRHGKRRER